MIRLRVARANLILGCALIVLSGLSLVCFQFSASAQVKQEPKAVPLPETTPVKPGTVRKNSIGMELVWVPPGDFMMGSTEAEVRAALLDCRRHRSYSCGDQWGANETPRRKITFAEGFWIGRFEVTQGEWQSVMGDNPSYFRDCGARCPVESISWEDVRSFLTRLNAQDKQFEYQLPSEAEWEYAARAGTTTTFAFGNELDPAKANFQGTQDLDFSTTPWKTLPVVGKTVAVGSFAPNAWGSAICTETSGNGFGISTILDTPACRLTASRT